MYFSDKEIGAVERSSEEITIPVWNGLVSIYKSVINNNELSGSFSELCPDGNGVCGCDRINLENAIKAEIPSISTPIENVREVESIFGHSESKQLDKYAILDLLEFIHKNITDCTVIGKYHDFHRHYHYQFQNHGIAKTAFREKVNAIFSRNGITFYLDTDGAVKRSIPEILKSIVSKVRFSTNDRRLNELLEQSYSKFVQPRQETRIESLEKIWDAFERMKTYFDENKRNSSQTLVEEVSSGNKLFMENINKEFKALTNIGNEFQIRHFERNKIQITSNLHIDYLFYRISSLIHLCVETLK